MALFLFISTGSGVRRQKLVKYSRQNMVAISRRQQQYISPDKTPTKIHQSKYYFSSLTASEVTQAEHELGICFPPQLKKFYLEVGYGYIGLDNPYFRNQIMRPKEIVKLRLGQDFYGNMSTDDLEYYSSNDVLPFFDLGGESDYLVIKLTGENKGSIIYFGDIIASDFDDFIIKMQKETDYFIN